MPHLKCEPCRARVYRAGEPSSVVEPCPVCGQPLQAVRDLAEIVGFRSVKARRSGAGYDAIAESVAAILAQRRAIERRSRRTADRWTP
jgi:hypothetical protein